MRAASFNQTFLCEEPVDRIRSVRNLERVLDFERALAVRSTMHFDSDSLVGRQYCLSPPLWFR